MSRPADHFEFEQDGESREVFMSFGLLNEVTTLMPDPAIAASVYFEPELREKVILTALHNRSKTGKIIDQTKTVDDEEIVIPGKVESLDDVDVPVSDIEALLAWEVEHAIGFFARSMDRVKGMKGQLESLTADVSSLNGSQASPSKKQSSGRSK